MSHGVKKETYVDADEKTTKALTYDLLDNLYTKMADTSEFQVRRMETCDKRFDDIEDCAKKRKRKDTAISAASGFGGGFTAVAITWLKKHFGG